MGSTSLWNVTAAGAAAALKHTSNAGTTMRVNIFPLKFRICPLPDGRGSVSELFDCAGVFLGSLRTHDIHGVLVERNRHVEEAEHHFVPALLTELNLFGRIGIVRIVGRIVEVRGALHYGARRYLLLLREVIR